MEILPARSSIKNPPEQFAGDVWLDLLVTPQDADQRTTVGRVRFAPGARTAWHSHARGQFLVVTQGIALVGRRDGTVVEVPAGRTIYTPAGEQHWHGAPADTFMEHLAIAEGADEGAASATWYEHVAG